MIKKGLGHIKEVTITDPNLDVSQIDWDKVEPVRPDFGEFLDSLKLGNHFPSLNNDEPEKDDGMGIE